MGQIQSQKSKYEYDCERFLAQVIASPVYDAVDDSVFITHLEAGTVMPASPRVAASHMALRLHRLATEEEVAVYRENFIRRTEAGKKQAEMERPFASKTVGNMKDALAGLLALKAERADQ